MKRKIIKLLFTISFVLSLTFTLFAQEPPPPPGDPGQGGTLPPVGGGAPIGEGIILLVALASGYGYKIYRKK